MSSDSGKIFIKYSNDPLIEESSSESDISNYKSISEKNVEETEYLHSEGMEEILYDEEIDDSDLSSEITYQVETDENNEKVLKLKIELIIDDKNNKLFTLNLNINKKTYLEMGKDLLKDE